MKTKIQLTQLVLVFVMMTAFFFQSQPQSHLSLSDQYYCLLNSSNQTTLSDPKWPGCVDLDI